MDSQIRTAMENDILSMTLVKLGDDYLMIKDDLIEMGYDEEDIEEYVFDYLKELE